MFKQQLLQLLKDKAWKQQHQGVFTLSSGKTSDFYINCKDVLLSAEGHYLLGHVLYEVMFNGTTEDPVLLATQGVAGVALGGCSLASSVSYHSWTRHPIINALYVRKEPKSHGTQTLIEGTKNLPLGSVVLVLEDVVTSGASSIEAIRSLRKAGYLIQAVLALVDREDGAKEALNAENVELYSVFKKSDFVSTI